MKKIAIPTRNDRVDEHFGHCQFYSIYTVNDDNEIADMESFNVLQSSDIQVVRGCQGKVKDIINLYLQGELSDNGENCQHHHHGEGHQCKH